MDEYGERLATIETKLDNLLSWVKGIDTKVNGMASHEPRIKTLEDTRKIVVWIVGAIIIGLIVNFFRLNVTIIEAVKQVTP